MMEFLKVKVTLKSKQVSPVYNQSSSFIPDQSNDIINMTGCVCVCVGMMMVNNEQWSNFFWVTIGDGSQAMHQ